MTQHRADAAAKAQLRRRLNEVVGCGRSAWPGVELPAEAFVDHLARHARPDGPLESVFEGVRVEELYLACACSHGVPAAHRVFERRFLPEGRRMLIRAGTPLPEDEFLQRLRERLIAPRIGAPARVSDFSGRGELGNWVRIAAHRLAVDGLRRQARNGSPAELPGVDALESAAADPELMVLVGTYREHFQAAFDDAFSQLDPRSRTLLRYRYVDGLEVNRIAAIARHHRVSVSRALRRARDRLLELIRRGLVERLRVGSTEADSLLRMMRSHVDVSLGRLLRSRRAAAGG